MKIARENAPYFMERFILPQNGILYKKKGKKTAFFFAKSRGRSERVSIKRKLVYSENLDLQGAKEYNKRWKLFFGSAVVLQALD